MKKRIVILIKESALSTADFKTTSLERFGNVNRLHSIKTLVESIRQTWEKEKGLELSKDNEIFFLQNVYPSLTDIDKKLFRFYTLDIEDEFKADSVIKELQTNENIEFAGYDNLNILYETPTYVPNDPYYSGMYGHQLIDCSQAWNSTTGQNKIVAVIDTGVDYNHPDLHNNLWNDGSGNYGYNFSEGNSNVMDSNGHGTHVAGTIAAVTNNGIGIAGIAFNSKIMALKIFPNAYDTVCANAIVWAANHGATVLNNSWGPKKRNPSNPVVEAAIDYAYSRGCICVFAAGNSNDDVQYYSPANYQNTISVGAIDSAKNRASFSNYGKLVDVSAPGVDILSLKIGGTYQYMSGTSQATPHVSGVCALLKAKQPALNYHEVYNIITQQTTPLNTDKPIGNLLNANLAVNNWYNFATVYGLEVTFLLTSDDKDKEEEIQLSAIHNGAVIGKGNFGKGIRWADPGVYPCTFNIKPINFDQIHNLKVRMFKTPYGSATGCGMQGGIRIRIRLGHDGILPWVNIPERRYGDNNPYDVTFVL